MSMEAMYLRAWIDGLHRINNQPPVRPVSAPAPRVRVDGPDRPPYVLLRPAGGHRA